MYRYMLCCNLSYTMTVFSRRQNKWNEDQRVGLQKKGTKMTENIWEMRIEMRIKESDSRKKEQRGRKIFEKREWVLANQKVMVARDTLDSLRNKRPEKRLILVNLIGTCPHNVAMRAQASLASFSYLVCI